MHKILDMDTAAARADWKSIECLSTWFELIAIISDQARSCAVFFESKMWVSYLYYGSVIQESRYLYHKIIDVYMMSVVGQNGHFIAPFKGATLRS